MVDLVISVGLPPRLLAPNERSHWGKRLRAKNFYKEHVARCALTKRPRRPMQSADVTLKFYFPDRRGLANDPDNLLAQMKYAFDALVGVRVLAGDNQLTHQPVERYVDRENPRVEIHLKPEHVPVLAQQGAKR
jgi:Holliday junction resolvase RusA-like endonuclease